MLGETLLNLLDNVTCFKQSGGTLDADEIVFAVLRCNPSYDRVDRRHAGMDCCHELSRCRVLGGIPVPHGNNMTRASIGLAVFLSA